jgi:hypothetical protein
MGILLILNHQIPTDQNSNLDYRGFVNLLDEHTSPTPLKIEVVFKMALHQTRNILMI